jgi:hypothetical protein
MKHEPASPLPLEAVPYRDPDEGNTMAVVYCDTFEGAVKTAAYIEHAANAYPKLIEALKFYANADAWKDIETGIGMLPGEALDHGVAARSALHQIGEDA